MTLTLPDTPESALALRIVRTLRDAGHTALFAGGCVRDSLLGRTPKDFDVATSARPDQVEALFPKTLAVGKSFGVIVVVEDNESVEVATFRSDGGYADGRHPESIRFSTPEEDASRRDFTVNGLFADPMGSPESQVQESQVQESQVQRPKANVATREGERGWGFSALVIDYVGGIADLTAHRIRAIGDPTERFQEDALRMLRAIRFAGALDFDIDPATFRAIRKEAERIRLVSMERIGQELVRMFTESPRAGRTLDLLRASGLLAIVLPEIQAMVGVAQPPQFHPEGDVFTHTRLMLDDMPPPARRDPRLAMAVLFHDVGKPPTCALRRVGDRDELRITFQGHATIGAEMTLDILKRLKRPNDFAEAVSAMVARHMTIVEAPKMRPAKLRRFLASPTMELELELFRLDILHSCGGFEALDLVRAEYDRIKAEPKLPPRWVKGADLIALGMEPGEAMGALLDRIYDRQLEGTEPDRESLLAWARKTLSEG